MIEVAMDWETKRIAAGQILPKGICCSFASRDEAGEIEVALYSTADPELLDMLTWVYSDPEVRIVTHNGGFDHGVSLVTYPQLVTLIFEKLYSGGAVDTLWREKLLNLSTTGKLDKLEMPDGSKLDIRYRLQDLEATYLGIDRGEEKEDLEDSWRANFEALEGDPASKYPADAAEYAKDDAANTLGVYEQQEQKAEDFPTASLETQEFQLAKSFVLSLMSAWGIEVHPEETDKLEAATIEVMEANKHLLEEHGILRTATYGEPFAKDLERAKALLPERWHADIDWSPYAPAMIAQGIKFKKPKEKPGSKDTKKLQAYVRALYKRLGEIPTYSDATVAALARGEDVPEEERNICLEEEIREYLATKDPVMAQYNERQALAKLVTQIVPTLRSGPVIFPSYDAIKETGRTSSYDGGKRRGKDRIYPSINIQQIPGEIQGLDPRRCFRPREGTVFFDVDFTGLELACVGHVTHQLFVEGAIDVDSVHRLRYNAGIDLHGFLGASLAAKSSPKAPKDKPWLPSLARDFQALLREEGIISDPMAVYEAFKLLKSHEEPNVRAFFKHFRNFAKPVGLGYPGGLGPTTMCEFARKTYGIIMEEDEASDSREMWHETYPEMRPFFKYIENSKDGVNFDKHGDELLSYTTPMGMVRMGATYCAAANGMCMQSPGAEAAMSAMLLVSRACYDPSLGSILLGCRPIAFVHDQVIGETTRDPELWAPQCEEVARLMREGAELVLHSIQMRTDEAHLTKVWSKASGPVRNEQGVLIPWEPK